jgi:integrase
MRRQRLPVPKLTKTVVEAAQPRDKQFTVWCSDLPGFGVYILPTGKRTYFVDYRNADGVRRRMTIGRHGKVTTEEARKLAVAALGSTVRGDDPALERTTRRKSLTVAELCDNYVKAVERGLVLGKGGRPKKASTLETDRGRVERHIKPLLGSKLVVDLKQSDVARFIRDVTAGKTAVNVKTERKRGRAIVEGGAGTASRTAGLLGGILSFAVSEGVLQVNPARGVKRPADRKRERRLNPAEYRALGNALEAAAEVELPQAVAGVWLIALTGCRLGEIERLRWSEVDLPGECLRLEDSKEGASVRPLSRRAVAVLEGLPRQQGKPYVLPAARKSEGHYGSLDAAVERIADRAELQGVTAHTLRHSFASVGDDLGFTENTVGAILGHAGTSITSRYIHKLDGVLIAAANKIADEIHRQMTGQPEAKVVRLPGTRHVRKA